MSRTASRTLTVAIIPSSRFVVSRFPAFIRPPPSVRRAGIVERRLRARRVEFVHDTEPVVGHFPELLDRLLKPAEFPAQLIDSGLEAIAHLLAPIRKEEVSSRATYERAHHCTCDYLTRLVHTFLLRCPTV